MSTKIQSNLSAALEYIKRDWHIFPLFYVLKDCTCSCRMPTCKRIGKHPIIKNGVLSASNDEAQVRQWWTDSPYANIGLATGHGGVVVVDVDAGVDKKTGLPKVGPQSWQALQEANNLVPVTLRVKTGGGGTHLYFLSTKEIKNSQDKLGKHLDVRGHGGYVILPPSNHESGGKYAWDGDDAGAAIADMPDWLEALLLGESDERIDPSQDFDPEQDKLMERNSQHNQKLRPEQLIKLLDFIPADCDRDTWWKVGAALKHELGDEKGWKVWETWSQKAGPQIYDVKTAVSHWQSFKDEGLTGGSIFYYAKENGFRGFDLEAAKDPQIVDDRVWVVSIKRFVDLKRFTEWDKEQFDSHFSPLFTRGAPSQHVLKNEGFRRVEGCTYWPQRPRFVCEINGQECLNYWRPPSVVPAPGDITPFLKHIEYLYPGERPEGAEPDDIHISRDGNILLDYLAFQVQRPGEKVHWAVLLVGDQGNGKSYFVTIMRLVLGEHNVGKVNNEQLHETFTTWQRNTQLIAVEEMMAKGRLELMDKLKPMITEDWCTIREMYRPAYEQPNRFNFLLLTNHDNALVLTKTDRRYCILKTESPAHPLSNAYYGPLFDWTRNNAPAIAHHLATRDLSNFQPKAHAPMTEGKRQMVYSSMLPIDQFIYDAVEAKEYPCQWDLLTPSVMVTPLNDKNIRSTPKQIGEAFQRLGYLNLGKRRDGKTPDSTVNLWVVRDFDIYRNMSTSQLRAMWLSQVNGTPNDPTMTLDPLAGERPGNPLKDREPM